jgi:threonine aldolase
MIIDFRSDTFTKPTPEMLEVMHNSQVGDDVFGEDPTVNRLEQLAAEMFGMESALFCPSGTMTNQIAIKCHTQPGDEVICERMSHVYIYEGGGIAFNSGCQVKPIAGDRGRITATQIEAEINPTDIHKARTRLVSLENTANRGGGSCYPWNDLLEIRSLCDTNKLALHLDGARLMNALVATRQTPMQYGQLFDSISLCLSKGLGAPVGSVLIGSQEFIKQARRVRKVFGGGMRQAGYLAAAGIFALENNVTRLNQDHLYAQQLSEVLKAKSFVSDYLPVETNILIFTVQGTYTPHTFADYMRERDILVMPISPTQVRMVTHLDIDKLAMERTLDVIQAM